ncbi:ATP-binding protein [Streptomyces sp. NPDC087440]|uniref:ATP-binding protein n=1 Tax=Streptomyces sp. NPDC087440 TaxID=3365790 RepID=UPI0037FF36F6
MALLHFDSTVVGRPASAAEARGAVTALLAQRPLVCDARTRDDILLVVSELVGNSLHHGGRIALLKASLFPHAFDLTVTTADGPPATGASAGCHPVPDGFGRPLVAGLAEVFTVTRPRSGGTRLRVQMSLHRPHQLPMHQYPQNRMG